MTKCIIILFVILFAIGVIILFGAMEDTKKIDDYKKAIPMFCLATFIMIFSSFSIFYFTKQYIINPKIVNKYIKYKDNKLELCIKYNIEFYDSCTLIGIYKNDDIVNNKIKKLNKALNI